MTARDVRNSELVSPPRAVGLYGQGYTHEITVNKRQIEFAGSNALASNVNALTHCLKTQIHVPELSTKLGDEAPQGPAADALKGKPEGALRISAKMCSYGSD